MLQYISEKTFQRLDNLTFVDLSGNSLNSIPPNLFIGNHRLQTLILRINDLNTLQWKTPSLSSLDLHCCELSNLSRVTFSSLPNLTIIDLSKNKLVILDFDTLSAHKQLQDVNLDSNPFECGSEFQTLLNAMHSNLSVVRYSKVACHYSDGVMEICEPGNQLSLYRPPTTPSVTPPYEPDTNAGTLLQPSATPSHNPDTNTSTTPKSSMTPSNKSDDSRNTTDNPKTPSEEENDTNAYIVAAVCFVVFVICMCVILCRRGIGQNVNADHEAAVLIEENR